MTNPNVTSITANGWKISANANSAQITRCAEEAWECYVSHFVTAAEAAAAAETSSVARLWNALTYLRYVQDVTFGTRTGGENKRMDYGNPPLEVSSIKSSIAVLMKEIEADFGKDSEIVDAFGVYFCSQFFN